MLLRDSRSTLWLKKQMFGNGIISDGRSVMLIVGTDPDLVAICSDHLGLVGLSKEYFDYMWADTLVPISDIG